MVHVQIMYFVSEINIIFPHVIYRDNEKYKVDLYEGPVGKLMCNKKQIIHIQGIIKASKKYNSLHKQYLKTRSRYSEEK